MNRISTLFLVLASPTLGQQTVTLGADRDNTIYENASGAVSNGAGTNMFVGRTGNGRVTRGIVRFDVASVVPQGAAVLSVRFEANVVFAANGAVPVASQSLHRVLADWEEGTTFASAGAGGQGAGGPATPGSVTFVHTFWPSEFWQTPGGDFEPLPSASADTPLFGVVTMDAPALVDDVQRWVDDPAANFGWVLRADDESTGARVYLTREGGGGIAGPRVVIDFDPPVGTPVCDPAIVNSSGLPGRIRATGSRVVAEDRLTLSATQLPVSTFGFFIVSDAFGVTLNPGGSFGDLCLAGRIGRYQNAVQSTGDLGGFDLSIDLGALPTPAGTVAATPGDTVYFQCWFRDQQSGVAGSNFTDALEVAFL